MSGPPEYSCYFCRVRPSRDPVGWISPWLLGLLPSELEIAEILILHEGDLSDGFGYYGSAEGFRHIVRLIVDKAKESSTPKEVEP